MAIAYRSQASLPNTTRTTTTVNMPAGVVEGDVVLVFCATGASAEVAITPPASLSGGLVSDVVYSATDPWWVRMVVYRYVVPASPVASFAFTHASSASEALAIAFSGVDTTTPIDATPTTNSGLSTTATLLGLTTTVNAAWLIAWRGSWDGNAITPPAGWTERLDQPVTWVAHQEWATAGATGDFSVPSGNGGAYPYGTILIPLRPAGVAGNTGTLSAALPKVTGAVAGTSVDPGTVAATLPKVTGSITGTSRNNGTLVAQLPKVTGSISSQASANTGTLTAMLPKVTGSVAGTSINPGTLGAVLPKATGSLAGTSTNAGTLAATLPKFTGTISDQATNLGTLTATLPKIAGAIVGSSINPATTNGTLPKVTGSILGTSRNPAVMAATLPTVVGSLAAAMTNTGTLVAVLPKVSGYVADFTIPPLPTTGVSLTVSTGTRGLTLTGEARDMEVST